MTYWDQLCPEHGGLSHVVIHEAGHAVMAVVLGVPFVDVSVNPDPRQHRNEAGRLTGGGVQLESPEVLVNFVSADPVGSLQFCLAGALAEVGGFGHTLKDSYWSDLNLWRNCAGLLEGQTEDSLEAELGRPFSEVNRSAKELIQAYGHDVTEVARTLGERWRLPYSEVYDRVTGTRLSLMRSAPKK